jgi:sec-independent protein translocase protein TatA
MKAAPERFSDLRVHTARLLMGRIGLPEMLIILAIIVVVFGANRLPDLGRGIGRAIRNFRDASKDESNPRS